MLQLQRFIFRFNADFMHVIQLFEKYKLLFVIKLYSGSLSLQSQSVRKPSHHCSNDANAWLWVQLRLQH